MKLKHIINSVVMSEIPLEAGEFTIGRNQGNSLQLEDAVVSGQHAVLKVTPNEYMPEMLDVVVTDLGSTNGVYVNNNKVTEQKIVNDDVVRIGTHEFKLIDGFSHTGTQTEYYVPEDD